MADMKTIENVSQKELSFIYGIGYTIRIIKMGEEGTLDIQVDEAYYDEIMCLVHLKSQEDILRKYRSILHSNQTEKEVKKKYLEEAYQQLYTEDKKLAIWLHEKTCQLSHNDCMCGWYAEIQGIVHDWDKTAHKLYLQKAQKILRKLSYSDFFKIVELLKNFGLGIKNISYTIDD